MRAAEREARRGERDARRGEREFRRHEEHLRAHHVRPQHMHHPRPVTPSAPPAAPQVSGEERMMILKMLSEGQITVEQAEQLLAALGEKTTTS